MKYFTIQIKNFTKQIEIIRYKQNPYNTIEKLYKRKSNKVKLYDTPEHKKKIKMENYTMQMKYYTIQINMKAFTIQMDKIKFYNV